MQHVAGGPRARRHPLPPIAAGQRRFAPWREASVMTDHYEDEEETRDKKHLLSNSQVLGFIGGFWLRRRWLLLGSVGLMLVAIGFDLALPWAAGRLVDAMGAGPAHL